MNLIIRPLKRKCWTFRKRRWFWQLRYGAITRNPFYPFGEPITPRRKTKPFAKSWYGAEFKRCIRFAKWYKKAATILKGGRSEKA